MTIEHIDIQKKHFENYADSFIKSSETEDKFFMYLDKRMHSIKVLENTLLLDNEFTKYSDVFRDLLSIEALYHDIGRFEQLKTTKTFYDFLISSYYPGIEDHGDLGSVIMRQYNSNQNSFLKLLIPGTRVFDDNVCNVIKAHSKVIPGLLDFPYEKYLHIFQNAGDEDIQRIMADTSNEMALYRINTAMIQDVDRLDILRKLSNGTNTIKPVEKKVDDELFELFINNKFPTIKELKALGKYDDAARHFVKLNFINQINFVSILKIIKENNYIVKMYQQFGNLHLAKTYAAAAYRLDELINQSEDGILVRRKTK